MQASSEGKKLAWYLCTMQKDSFSLGNMGNGAKACLETIGQCDLGDIATKDELFRVTAIVYDQLDHVRKRKCLWELLVDSTFLVDRAKPAGLRQLFAICSPSLTDEHLSAWIDKLLGLILNLQLGTKEILLINASGSKGLFKSTGIPLALHLFLLGYFPQDSMHKSEDLKNMLSSHLSETSRAKLERLLSDCKGISPVHNFIFVSTAPQSAMFVSLSLTV
jgi:hypothetical protein